MTYIEEADYRVTVTLTTSIGFSPIERDSKLSESDAIGNAQGTVSEAVWTALRDEGWHIEFHAEPIFSEMPVPGETTRPESS